MGTSRKVNLMFLEIKEAYDCADREGLMRVMREVGTEENLVVRM